MQIQQIAQLINSLQDVANTTDDEKTLIKINVIINNLFNNYIPQ